MIAGGFVATVSDLEMLEQSVTKPAISVSKVPQSEQFTSANRLFAMPDGGGDGEKVTIHTIERPWEAAIYFGRVGHPACLAWVEGDCMKRLVVLSLLVCLIAVLSGVTPAASGQFSCQVVATTAPKSCTITNRGLVTAYVVGTGGIQTYGPNGTGTYVQCPGAHLGCSGGITNAYPGYPVVLTVKKGYGRIQNPAVAVGF